MNKPNRLTALILTALMIIPLVSAMILPISAAPTLVSSQDFESYGEKVGAALTQEDGFGTTVPSSTTVVKENGNTYLKMELASYVEGVKNPTDTVHYMHGGKYEIVEEGTEGALTTDRASYGLISGRDDNLDKNLIPNHPAIGADTTNCVILSVDYYLSEDANGTLQTQAFQFISAETGEEPANWLSLFRIDAETGVFFADSGSRNSDVKLTKGEWNTVTMVIDTEQGRAHIFVDSALAVSNVNLGKTMIKFPENSFIVGKVPRTTNSNSVASQELGGYICIDNVHIYSADINDNSLYTSFPQADQNGGQLTHVQLLDAEGNMLKELPYTELYFNPLNGGSINPVYFSLDQYQHIIPTKSEISLRLTEPGGIRFVNKLDGELYEQLLDLKEMGAIKDVNFGTLIAPEFYVREARFFTIADLHKLDRGTVNYIKVEGTYGEWYNDEEYTFAGSISNILPSHYDDAFTAVGYVEIRFTDDTVHYIYGGYQLTNSASMIDLAEKMLNSEEAKDLSTNEINFLKQYKIYDVDIGIAHISDITIVKNHLFFKTSETYGNVYMALSYSGNHGWRVKATRANGIGVESYGAAQALADYMGEDAPVDALPITLKNNDGKLIAYAEDGSYVEILYKIRFMMIFYSAPVPGTKDYEKGEGVRMTSIQEIRTDGDSISFRGGLKVGEAVYGGGERFDNVNKVNTGKIQLYTRDGWNDSRASYLAIPFFTTTRGTGIYVNRYEEMTANFVSGLESYWEIDAKSHVMDCYFFTSVDMKDSIKSYSELTGYAEKPDEWAHGVMLCRYATDLRSFETDVDENNRDGAPSGRSVKTLVTNMINAGMKPSSVVMEAWNYQDITVNTAKQDELRKACEWLEEQGIKAMVYMRVGNSFSTSDPDFKDEYFLHAWVTNQNGTTYTNRIPDTVANSGNPDVGSNAHYYIDITNPEAMEWYCDTFWGKLLDLGVDGVKIDFCETMPDEFYQYGSTIVDYDYYDETKIVSGTEHHAYSTYFISAFFKRMNELKEEKGMDDGFVVLSRGGGIGSQRNPYLWAGDQVRAFTKLDDQVRAVVNCGLSGVPFMTYDMAGYRYGFGDKIGDERDGTNFADEGSLEYESAVFARAIAFTAFTSNIQTHGTVRNAYDLTEDAQQIYRNFTALHEDLMPYITELVDVACATGLPPVRHPVLHYQSNTIVRNLDLQFMLGDALMITPVLSEDPGEVKVYLPEGTWTNLLTGEVVQGDEYYKVSVNLGQIPVFLNNDSEAADEMREIFAGEAWTAIKNFVPTPAPEENTPEVTE